MQLTDTLSHNIIGRLAQWGRTNFVLPHWASRPSPVASRPSGHKKVFYALELCAYALVCSLVQKQLSTTLDSLPASLRRQYDSHNGVYTELYGFEVLADKDVPVLETIAKWLNSNHSFVGIIESLNKIMKDSFELVKSCSGHICTTVRAEVIDILSLLLCFYCPTYT